MSAARLLLEIVPGHPQRQEAWSRLYTLLTELGRAEFTSARTGAPFRIPEADREDIVQAVALKVHQSSPLPVAGKSEGECKRYLLMMLRNRWIDEQRRRARQEKQAQAAALEEAEPQAEPAPSESTEVPQARKLLETVYQHLHAQRAPRFRPELERNWAQLQELSFEGGDMDELLRRDEGVTATTSVAERKAAQQRIHQNHSRLRKHLGNAVDAMARQRLLSPEDAAVARQLIDHLNRCQRSGPAGVSRSERTEAVRAKREEKP